LLSALLFAGIFAAATALAELLSPSGYDNLTVPIMTVAILLLLTWQGFI
jgi:dolichol kinase